MMQRAQLCGRFKKPRKYLYKKIKNKEDLFNNLNLDKSKYKDQIEQWAFESPQEVQQIIEYLHKENNLQEAEAEEQKRNIYNSYKKQKKHNDK